MIRPLNDRILVERESAKDKIGSFFLPTQYQEKPCTGKVVVVGPGALVNGKRVKCSCKVGDVVIFSQHAGVDIKLSGKEYTLMKEEGVLGIVE